MPSEPTPSTEPAVADGKKCPFCAETIQAAAIKCRYCGELLPSASDAAATPLLAQPHLDKVSDAGSRESTPSSTAPAWMATIAFWVISLLGVEFIDIGLYRAFVNHKTDPAALQLHAAAFSPVLSLVLGLAPGLIFAHLVVPRMRGSIRWSWVVGTCVALTALFFGVWAGLMSWLYNFDVREPANLVAVGVVAYAAAALVAFRIGRSAAGLPIPVVASVAAVILAVTLGGGFVAADLECADWVRTLRKSIGTTGRTDACERKHWHELMGNP